MTAAATHPPGDRRRATGRAAGRRAGRRAGRLAMVAALAGGVVTWAAAPVSGGSGGTLPALVAAITAGAMSIGQLALATATAREPGGFAWTDRLAQNLVSLVRTLPWAELMTVAALLLEALHRSRPWHTGILAVMLIGYLLAVHLAETDTSVSALRALLSLLSVGIGLTALAVGVTAVPGMPPGPAATIIRIGAIVLAVVATGLAVPVWLGRSR